MTGNLWTCGNVETTWYLIFCCICTRETQRLWPWLRYSSVMANHKGNSVLSMPVPNQDTFKVIWPSPLSRNSKRLNKSWYSSSNWPWSPRDTKHDNKRPEKVLKKKCCEGLGTSWRQIMRNLWGCGKSLGKISRPRLSMSSASSHKKKPVGKSSVAQASVALTGQ